MLLEELDFLSPKITLFHYGNSRHSSKFGAILTILSFLLCLTYIISILKKLIFREDLSLYYYQKFDWEAGKFFFDNKGIYHFIQPFTVNEKGGYISKYEKKYIRIFTTSISETYASNPSLLNTNDHWVYDLCEKGKDDEGLSPYLFDKIDNFTNSACIKYYFNSADNKYYNKTDKKFIYPSIEHGNARSDNTFLGTFIEKCRNDSITTKILGKCGNIEEINLYLKKTDAIYLKYVDHYVDPTNVKHPIQTFMNSISGKLSEHTYPVHNVNFKPLIVKTDKGLILEEIIEDKSFIFDVNRIDGKSNSGEALIVSKISYWMQNNFIIYERYYKKILETMSTIGGLKEFIHYFLFAVNYLYHKYILLLHTKFLFVKIQSKKAINLGDDIKIEQIKFMEQYKNMEKNEILNESMIRKFSKNKINMKYNIDNDYEKKVNNPSSFNCCKSEGKKLYTGQNSEINNFIKNQENNLFKNKLKNNIEKELNDNTTNLRVSKNEQFYSNNSKKEESFSIYISGCKDKSELKMNNKKRNDFDFEENVNNNQLINDCNMIATNNIRYNIFKAELKFFMNENKKKIQHANKKISFMDENFSFYDYLSTLCCNKTNKNGVYILDHFRKKLLSEEHFYRSHLNLYLLEKYFEIEQEKANIFELYKYL